MKKVLKKLANVLYDVIKFAVAIAVLALLAAVLIFGLAIVPIAGLAQTIVHGGTLYDNTSDIFNYFMNEISDHID